MTENKPGFDFIEGGVCAPKGFCAAGMHSGFAKDESKKDLALIYCERICDAAAVYTKNKVQASCIDVTRAHLLDGRAQAIIANSGNANACNADGVQKASAMCALAASALHISPDDVLVASTGVIGQPLPLQPVQQNIEALAGRLSKQGSSDAAQAIMTTDTKRKEHALRFDLGGVPCTLAGIAKGSGMIHPNMGTMLCFVTTDARIEQPVLAAALSDVVEDTFNMVSVDGDTSTNDTVTLMASGLAGNAPIRSAEGEDYATFKQALFVLLRQLAREIAADGEGASKLLECSVRGAVDIDNAKIVAKAVITSSLFKCAMFGEDANWGRILCAIGYSGADLDVAGVDVALRSAAGGLDVCKDGAGVPFSEEKASEILGQPEICIDIRLRDGDASAVAWGCDLTYDYVRINGDYRS